MPARFPTRQKGKREAVRVRSTAEADGIDVEVGSTAMGVVFKAP